ncbi:photosystem II S4 domain protein [Candidatus Cyanaurora vandensis]|uniref:photosystem II S4 domain protein n=1 Tax=Candidatus Cyanaurora vandensis TaxID=2714958 RepID=UPI0025796010|nr:photosystem II S4 domain protein [Candidatus Cyanaurora vandensis]
MQLPRNELLKGAEFRDTLARVIDLAERALQQWGVCCSDFLPPPELEECLKTFAPLSEVQVLAWGGYPQAERQRLALAHSSQTLTPEQVAVTALEIRGNFLFDPASHRDFLGALLGVGLTRDKFGDLLLVKDRGAQVLVVPEAVQTLETLLVSIRTVPVQVVPIPLEQLQVRPPQVKEMTTTEASLRLDAVASAGFGVSRSRMTELINSGEVKVNWRALLQPAKAVKSGDRITLRGKGRLEVGEVQITPKGRYRIQLRRYS